MTKVILLISGGSIRLHIEVSRCCAVRLTGIKMAITKSPKNHEKDSDSKSVSNDDSKNDGDLEERILIPSSEGDSGLFSWRKLWLFTGPGWLSKYCKVANSSTSWLVADPKWSKI